ncbi:MAG: glutathione S-transferase C-terminal domain-containing protein, partial [Hyphomonadaceae bacterium]|nr:glutathione S-transferase C-terminal domain-containing protein [Hyphomonadaceae bacterium]
RWNFEAENRAFLAEDFAASLTAPGSPPEERAAVFAQAAGRMRKAMASFGVNEATIPAVEASFETFLKLFDAHLEGSPYLLGGRPTIGDYGLIGPLGAHLGRDPHPTRLIQQLAPRVWRWRERMHRPDRDAGEYGDAPEALFAEDGAPETLKALLRFVAEDYLPEVRAHVAFCNEWLAARPDIAPGTSGLERTQERRIGVTTFPWRGQALQVGVMPYRLYLLQKVQDAADRAPPEAGVAALLEEVGLGELRTLRTSRRIVRRNHLEVWA